MDVNEIANYAFNSFDPSASFFDPNEADNAAGKVRRIRNQANIDLTLTNNLGTVQRVELFNYLRSISKINNPAIVPLATARAATVDNIIQNPAATTENSLIFFDQDGNLIIQNGAGNKLTVAGNQVPYRALFESTIQSPFVIDRIRMTFTTDPQIDKPIKFTRQTFLGSASDNTITPRSFQSPMQQQSKIVDIVQSFPIDAQSGFNFELLNGETVTMSLFLSIYTNVADARKL